MRRYKVASLDQLMREWNPAQIVIAVDAMFWGERKEADRFTDSPYQIATARPLTARMLAGLE